MGQQQLILLVLGVILTGLFISAGTRMSQSYYQGSSRDQLIMNIQGLTGLVESYAKTPTVMGGGGGKYTGIKIVSGLLKTSVGQITYTTTANQMVFTAVGVTVGNDGKNSIRVVGTYKLGILSISIGN